MQFYFVTDPQVVNIPARVSAADKGNKPTTKGKNEGEV